MGGYVGIPASYTPVEYIKSSGTQYIDTGYSANSNTKLELKLQFTSASHQEFIFCGRDFNNGTAINAFSLFRNTSNQFRVDYSSVGTLFSHTVTANNDYTYVMDKNELYENNVLIRTETNASFSATNKLRLFSAFNSDSTANNFFEGKVFYCKIWDNDTLVRDFIPVIDQDNVACLYEQVEGNFYYNQGSGAFVAGNTTGSTVIVGDKARKILKAYVGIPVSYTPVEYIETLGPQYVDTGVLMKDTLKVEGEFYDVNNYGYWYGARKNVNGVYPGITGTSTDSDTNHRFTYGGITGNNFIKITPQVNTWHTVSHSRTLYLDNSLVTTFDNSSFSIESSLCVFALNDPPNLYTGANSVRMKWFKVYDGNLLVRDFIPVLDENNIACLYEQVEGKFYYNKGTGSFAAGSTTGQAVSLGSKARNIIKGYVGVDGVARQIYSSYIQLNYIEATGTQYIDTGTKVNSDYKVELEISNFPSTTGSSWRGVCGSRTANGSSDRHYLQLTNFNYFIFAYGSSDGNFSSGINLMNKTLISIDKNVAKIGNASATATTRTFTSSYTYYLFAINNAGSAADKCSYRLHSAKIYDSNNILVKDFIPVLDTENVPCLYEKIESKFYYNKGTGTFGYGTANNLNLLNNASLMNTGSLVGMGNRAELTSLATDNEELEKVETKTESDESGDITNEIIGSEEEQR